MNVALAVGYAHLENDQRFHAASAATQSLSSIIEDSLLADAASSLTLVFSNPG